METKSKWAGVVHSRTFQADYRPNFLAVPDDIAGEELRLLRECCEATSRSIGSPSGGRKFADPVYVCLLAKGFTFAGIWVNNKLVCDDEDYCRDEHGRTFGVLLGYISREQTPKIQLPAMKIEDYKPLYQLAIERWGEKQSGSSDSTPTLYEKHFEAAPATIYPNAATLNSNPALQRRFPESESDMLWAAITAISAPCSLIVSTEKRKADSFFMNAVCRDCRRVEEHPLREMEDDTSTTATSLPSTGSGALKSALLPSLQAGGVAAAMKPYGSSEGQSANAEPQSIISKLLLILGRFRAAKGSRNAKLNADVRRIVSELEVIKEELKGSPDQAGIESCIQKMNNLTMRIKNLPGS